MVATTPASTHFIVGQACHSSVCYGFGVEEG